MKLKYFATVLSILGIVFLYFLSLFSQPLIIELHEIPKYEGKQVIVEGIVTNHYLTSYGGQIIEIKDGNATENSFKATIFVEKETAVEYGDRVQVTGKVQKYRGEWEIVVNNERFVRIIQKWQNITFPLWQLAENPNRYVGVNVNVTGIIDRIYDNYFYLVDSEEEHLVVVFYDPSVFYNFSQGDKVYVAAKFAYDEETLRYVLRATEEIHSIFVVGRE